ncbi:hypothetical protein C8J57DRAFT_1482201 [Mycena rebaudengoi]|nr:hypothetical protein C8J57DRAFT_1482201 [Mycena rebaudengoi]
MTMATPPPLGAPSSLIRSHSTTSLSIAARSGLAPSACRHDLAGSLVGVDNETELGRVLDRAPSYVVMVKLRPCHGDRHTYFRHTQTSWAGHLTPYISKSWVHYTALCSTM